MGGYRKPSVRPMPRRLYRFTTERRTSVNRYLLTVDFPWPRRNQPNSPLLFFLRPVISPFVPSSFFSLSGHLTVCVCVYHPPLSFPPIEYRFSLGSSFVLLSPSLASLPSLASSLLVARTRVLSIPLAVPDVVEATPAGGVAGGGADRDGRGPGAVVMKTYEIYSIWADAITPPPPPPTTDRPTILPHSLDPCTLATPMCRVNRCW